MGRPKGGQPKRVRCIFTTLPEVVDYINKERGFMTFSEFVHRCLVADYNKKHPDKKLELWKPGAGK